MEAKRKGYKTRAEKEKISSNQRMSEELKRGSKRVRSSNKVGRGSERRRYENEYDHELKLKE